MGTSTIILLVAIAVLAFFVIGIYNNLVALRNRVKNAWSQVDVQLQRRYDLIPNLIETVKGYMGYEKGTLEEVVRARNQAVAARESIQKQGGPTEGSLKELMGAEAALSGSLGRIFALAENYPQLRASEPLMKLQEELSSTENKVAFARQAYNDQVLAYNTSQQKFPNMFFASAFGHHPADFYEIESVEMKKNPKVTF
jgi:LemA protein